MKIMIAYDGSECARAALADLKRAGLRHLAETKVVSVVEPFVSIGRPEMTWGAGVTEGLDVLAKRTRQIVRQGKYNLQRAFPGWVVKTSVYRGQRAEQLVAHAAEWEPELLVINPLDRTEFERMVLGSLSRNVVENATCSVRVARKSPESDLTGLRLLLGYDGSRSAAAALCEIASRLWPAETTIRLVAATEPVSPTDVTSPAATDDARQPMSASLDQAAQFLREAGLSVSVSVHHGSPRCVLLEQAETWGAHCIFLGRNRHNSFSRLFMDSTSAAIAAQAPCTVEVVREEQTRKKALAAPAQPPRKAALAITH